MRRTHARASILTLALVFYSVGCGRDTATRAQRSAGGGSSAVPVEVIVIRPRPLQDRITATGTLLANEEAELRPEISGRIVGLYFAEGRPVPKGTLLLKINDRELQAQLARKESEEKLAADDERRKRSLFETHAISQEEYDKSLNTLKIVQSEKEVIKAQIAKTEIVAPFDGVVGLRHVSEGEYISPNSLLATMQDVDPIKVEFSVPEKYVRQLKIGLGISVRTADSPEEHRGEVYAVESKIDPGTRTITARARIANPERLLIPGAFGRVSIILGEYPDAIVIPTEALIPELGGARVFVCRNATAQAVSVKTGLRTDRDVQITEGLSADDTLIVTGLLQLSDGRRVEARQRQL